MIKNFRKLEENDLDQVSGGVFVAPANNGGAVMKNDLMVKPGVRPKEDHLVQEVGKPHIATKVGGVNQGEIKNPSDVLVVSGGMDGELV
jgi:CBS domain-containing protein